MVQKQTAKVIKEIVWRDCEETVLDVWPIGKTIEVFQHDFYSVPIGTGLNVWNDEIEIQGARNGDGRRY